MNAALADVRAGKAAIWSDRAGRLSTLIEEVRPLLKVLGLTTEVTVTGAEHGGLIALAHALNAYLSEGGKLKTSATGQPKIGMLTNKLVKEAKPLSRRTREPLAADEVERLDLFFLGSHDGGRPARPVGQGVAG